MIPPSQGNKQPAEARRHRHDEPGGDLHDADDVHGVRGAPRQDVVELAGQVARPVVRQDLGELVEAEQDRRRR
jgi:hypothetical protein